MNSLLLSETKDLALSVYCIKFVYQLKLMNYYTLYLETRIALYHNDSEVDNPVLHLNLNYRTICPNNQADK